MRAVAAALVAALCSACTTCAKTSNHDAEASTAPAKSLAPVQVKRSDAQLLLLDEKARRSAAASPALAALRANVDAHLDRPDESSIENAALVYLLTSEPRYAKTAYAWLEKSMAGDVRSGSYLGYGDYMRPAALVLEWCGAALSDAERKKIVDYLDRWTQELWFDNKGSGWGLEDPGNNYHAAFLEGTAFAARALAGQSHPNAARYEALLRDKIEREGGLLSYLNDRGVGGDWSEGANYGQRTKQRLGMAFAAIATTGGPDYFAKTKFFDQAITYAVYQLQPDRRSLHPSGDLARDSAMLASAYDRDYLQLFAYFSRDARARGLARWYLETVVPSYESGSFRWSGALHKDVLFAVDAAPLDPGKLPLFYQAAGTGFVNLRSGWDQRATSLTLSAPTIIDQSHAHLDAASFTLFKGGWQAIDAVSRSRSGLVWEAGAHNAVHVEGHERRGGRLGGLSRFVDAGGFAYAQIDATALHRRRGEKGEEELLDEHVREIVYLRPDAVVVYDRVAPKSESTRYALRMHFFERPKREGETWTAAHGNGAIAVRFFHGGRVDSRSDDDLEGGSEAFRLEVAPRDAGRGRFLSVMQVGWGGAPELSTESIESESVAGARVGDRVVVFSAAERGKPVSLPFRYRVPSGDSLKHLLFDVEGSVDVDVARDGSATAVTVRRGSRYKADPHGVVRF